MARTAAARNLQHSDLEMPAESEPPEAHTLGEPAPIRLIDTLDGQWRVYEQASVYDRRSTPDLVFESEGVIRRVRNYPPNWMELSDAALLAVSWGR